MSSKIKNTYGNMSLPAKASMWFIICSIIQKGITFATTPFFTRVLCLEAYGTVVLYSSWMEVVSIFATFQLTTGVFNKAMVRYEEDRDGYTSSSLFLTSIITVLLCVIYLITNSFWTKVFQLPTEIMIMMFADILVSTAMAFWSIRNRFEYRYKSVIGFTLFVAIVGPTVSLFLCLIVSSNTQAQAKIFGMLIVKVCAYIPLFIVIARKGKKAISLQYWKYSLVYNIPLIPHYLSHQILSQSDRIMINNICGSSNAAVYGVAYQLSTTIFMVTYAINNSYTPWVFTCIKDNNTKGINRVSVEIEALVGGMCFLFTLFAPEAIYLLGGKPYMEAIWIVPPVVMSVLFQTIYSFWSNVEFYFEKTKFVMVASILCAIANIILNYFFIPRYGFVAAGYTTLACYIMYSVIHFIFMKNIFKSENVDSFFDSKMIWGISLICIFLSFVATFLYLFFIVRYIVILMIIFVTIILGYKNRKLLRNLMKKSN